MRIILLKDVPKVGQRNDIKNVADGFALNFLIPRGLAKKAIDSEVSRIAEENISKKQKTEKQEELFLKNLSALKSKKISIKSVANEKGHLFKGVNAEEMAPVISKEINFEVKPDQIKLEKPIKEIGEHEIGIEVFGTKASVKILVEPQGDNS